MVEMTPAIMPAIATYCAMVREVNLTKSVDSTGHHHSHTGGDKKHEIRSRETFSGTSANGLACDNNLDDWLVQFNSGNPSRET